MIVGMIAGEYDNLLRVVVGDIAAYRKSILDNFLDSNVSRCNDELSIAIIQNQKCGRVRNAAQGIAGWRTMVDSFGPYWSGNFVNNRCGCERASSLERLA